MSFEIHNPKGIVIPTEELNKEAAEFWGVKYDPDRETHPDLPHHWTNSWIGCIGYGISLGAELKNWDDVKFTLWILQCRPLCSALYDRPEFERELKLVREFLKPYYELIDHWKSKGYIPIQLNSKP